MERLSREDQKLLEFAQRQHTEGKLTDEELAATIADVEASPTPEPERPAWKRQLGLAMVTVGLIASAFIVYAIINAAFGQRFERIAEACDLPSVVGDGGDSLTIRGGGEQRSIYDASDIACVLREADAPSHVMTHITSTRALDGQQTASWDGISARWTYHPDPGLSLILVEE